MGAERISSSESYTAFIRSMRAATFRVALFDLAQRFLHLPGSAFGAVGAVMLCDLPVFCFFALSSCLLKLCA
jgi:hypothetical protein